MGYYPVSTHLKKEDFDRVERCVPKAGCKSIYAFVKTAVMEKVESLEEAEKLERTSPGEEGIGEDSGKDRPKLEDID